MPAYSYPVNNSQMQHPAGFDNPRSVKCLRRSQRRFALSNFHLLFFYISQISNNTPLVLFPFLNGSPFFFKYETKESELFLITHVFCCVAHSQKCPPVYFSDIFFFFDQKVSNVYRGGGGAVKGEICGKPPFSWFFAWLCAGFYIASTHQNGGFV